MNRIKFTLAELRMKFAPEGLGPDDVLYTKKIISFIAQKTEEQVLSTLKIQGVIPANFKYKRIPRDVPKIEAISEVHNTPRNKDGVLVKIASDTEFSIDEDSTKPLPKAKVSSSTGPVKVVYRAA